MMRKCILLVLALLFPFLLYGQLQGNGTFSSPYIGTLVGSMTWSGTKYIGGDITVDNEKLTISAGSKIIFLNTMADLRIVTTGQLEVKGTSTSGVTFTADFDNDGRYGEAGEYWGNILFTSTAASSVSYSTIEFGVKTEAGPTGIGGGISISSTSVTVNNVIIRNCTANKGGAIHIGASKSPVLSRVLVYNCVAQEGGAIYIAAGASPTISNCILRKNQSSSASLSGGAIVSYGSSAKIINCTVVQNTAATTSGQSMRLDNSPGMLIINTISWGSGNQIEFLNGTTSSVLVNSAVGPDIIPGTITLDANNTAETGPHFVDPTTFNYHIDFASPCTDAGLSSYTGVTIPTSDYENTPRFGPTDIGAYEGSYARWIGTTSSDWTVLTNWFRSVSPTNNNVIIPSGCTNYPTSNTSLSYTVASGKKLVIEPGAKATFASLTNNGKIVLESDATGIFSLLTNSYSGSSGTLKVDLFITGGSPAPGLYRWHYIAPPVNTPKSVFTSINPYNLLSYDQSKVTTDVSQGWQWHDGYDGTTGFSTLEAKKGYNVFNTVDATLEFNNLTTLTTSLGQINLPFNTYSTDTTIFGYSLVGNSLTCGINWDLVTRSSTTYVRNAIYITTNDNVASYVNGVGTNGGTAHIPPLQGFMVKTRATGTYITIPDNAREHNSTLRFKSSTVIPLVRLEVSKGLVKDETVIRLENQATLKFDSEYDAGKMYGQFNAIPQICTVINQEQYSINSIPWPETFTIVPLALKIPSSGTYKIKQTEYKGMTCRVTLTDNNTGNIIDLSAFPEYTFTAMAGTITDRFLITIYSGTAGLYDYQYNPNTVNIYSSHGKICIQPTGDDWTGAKTQIDIFDLTGNLIIKADAEAIYSGEIREFEVKSSGIYIVEIIKGTKRFTKKIVIAK